MPINFPNSPSIGATYDYEGIHYIYNGVGWVNKSIFGISAGTNISFTNYNGTGPLIISATDTTGITSAVTSFNGYTGGVTGWAYYNDGINSGLDTDLIQGISGQRFVENLQTGLLYGGLVQVNAGNSAYFDVSAGVGIISTAGASLTAYPTPSLTYVTWNAFTGVTVTGIASDEETWISINSAGNVVQQNTKWLDSQFDNSIPLGVLIHPNNTTINFAVAIPHVAYGQPSQLDPFVRAFGPIKISGHEISANGANLQVNKSTGAAYLIGRNYATNPSSPNVVEDTNATPISTIYRYYRDGSGKFTVVTNSSIDPTKYDDGTGTLNTVPGGQYTIQRLFFLPGVPTVLASYYGRELYNSIETAQANIPFEQFNEDDSTASLGVFGGYLIVKSGATQLNNTADAKFINSGIFRNLSNIGGGGVAATSLDDLNDVTITSAANGQVLKYSSGVWVNESVSNLNLVSAAVAGSGISVSGATGSVTVTNTGVLSFNGNTGAIQGVSSINGSTGAITNVAFTNVNNNFSVTQNFAQGLTAANTVEFYADTSYFYPAAKGNRFLTVSPGPQNFISGSGNSSVVINQNAGNNVYIGDADISNNGTYIRVEDNTSTIAFNYGVVQYSFPTSAGNSGQVLTTNGVNSLNWANNVSTLNGATGDVKEFNYAMHRHESGATGITAQCDFVVFNDFILNNHSSSIPNGPWIGLNANGGSFTISTAHTTAFGFDTCNGTLGLITGTTSNATGYAATLLQANLIPGIPTPSNGFVTKYEIECRFRTDTDVTTQGTVTRIGFSDIFTNSTPADGVYFERIYNGTTNETTFKVVFRNGGSEERIDTSVAFSANTTYRVYLCVERNTAGNFTTSWEIVNDSTGTTSSGTASPTTTARYPSASTDYLNVGAGISKSGAVTTTSRVLILDYIGARIRRPLRRGMKLFA